MDLMKKISTTLFALLVLLGGTTYAQEITGLNGFSIFLDQGHSQTENMGLYNYSEAEKTLRVGLALRDLLLELTDIDTVYTARTTDSDQIGLSQRSDLANSLGVDFYYSIHSDAGGPTANSTLFMYGGWRENGQTVEKNPKGGKDFSDIMETVLPAALRIGSRGVFADRTFYQGFPTNHDNDWPYLSVNRRTNMASMLSEAGFHTNPFQQQRNLNADYKRLEAQASFWVVLEYLGVERPPIGIATGVVSDADNGLPVNGATISINGQDYVTDSYASLFNQYSNDPDQLRNGFYYIENLPEGINEVITSAPGFYSDTTDVDVITTDFSFKDIGLISSKPPVVTSTSPVEGDTTLNPSNSIVINFSRNMDQASVIGAFSIEPEVTAPLVWSGSKKLFIQTSAFDYETEYTITIDSTAKDGSVYQHGFDGDADGNAGGDFVLNFKTGPEDIAPPKVTSIYPFNTIVDFVRPIVSIVFDELVDTNSIDASSVTILDSSQNEIAGEYALYNVGEQSFINFFPTEDLISNADYIVRLKGGFKDLNGNISPNDREAPFETQELSAINTQTIISDFEDGISPWWLPQQSGSTTGIVTEGTDSGIDTTITNLLTGSASALRVDYEWDVSAGTKLIREYRNSSSPKFSNTSKLQAYVFGDGSENKFRFMVRDGSSQLEGSEWYTVDWLGWKLVTWDLASDPVVGWANGDGTLNGSLYFDSFQLTYTEGSNPSGFFVFDDLRAVTLLVTSIDDEGINLPTEITLNQNYPNPFNPSTNIEFGLPNRSEVRIELYDMLGRKVDTIFEGTKSPGVHIINYDASALASGMYIYRLVTGNTAISKKMMLIK